ncbi:MAG TPA: c-type cytochrome biogenesis protein CcmI [Caulobacteraceae bacterium]|nr:c-type cytochrome biogenesis protein CcmI [Caulobacteraceae bacterium]
MREFGYGAAMIWLWMAAALVSAGLAALIVHRAARAARADRAANPALAVYRRQMAELDDLATRGLIAEGERRSVRAETGRRLLAAAERSEAPLKVSGPLVVLAAAAAVPLIALTAYVVIGSPRFPDQPFATRLADWRAADPQTLTAPQMAAVLRQIAAEKPTDAEPLMQLAVAELASNQLTEATQALQRAIALAPARSDLWQMQGEIAVIQSGGDVPPDAQDAFRRALAIDPNLPIARYYLARARIAGGDVAGGLADWRALEASLDPREPRRAELDAEIQQVAATGRLAPAALPPSRSPNATPQIQQMVDGLAARLEASPDDPQGWVRLVRAYTVLGETDRRDKALGAARKRYADRPDVLGALDAAARPPS